MSPEELREARSVLGLTQAKLADALGVQRGAVRDWESGKIPIDLRTSLAILALRNSRSMKDEIERLQARVGIAAEEEGEE